MCISDTFFCVLVQLTVTFVPAFVASIVTEAGEGVPAVYPPGASSSNVYVPQGRSVHSLTLFEDVNATAAAALLAATVPSCL